MARKPQGFNFEKALEELEAIVESMEEGKLSLEDSLKQFEKGIALTRQCQESLAEAEQTVKKLSKKHKDAALVPFEADEDADE